VTAEERVYARLAELGIAYERYEHPPVPTVEDAARHWADIRATHCKNLFVRNQKGNHHYLIVMLHSKKADLRAVADQIGDGKLSFASPARLLAHLGVTPGSVSPFGLINNQSRDVHVMLDNDLRLAECVSFHPNINTRTLVISREDFDRFLAACGNPTRYITI
jgi:Ala-tRNA(Pro) deacylase